jgi:hypothetical protein
MKHQLSIRTTRLVSVCTIAATLAVVGCGSEGTTGPSGERTSQVASPVGATYQVGPGKPYADLQSVVSRLAPGDVVEVSGKSGAYPGGVVFRNAGTATNRITIRGIRVNGARPVISGSTNTVQFEASHYVFEGFDVTSGGFRNIYHHADDITVRDTVVHDCVGHGIQGADTGSGSLTLDGVEVYRCGEGTQKHPIYMATDEVMYPNAVFRMQSSYLHDQRGGNNVKTRAGRNELYYNWIEGGFYREIELIAPETTPESVKREDSDVVGNVFVKTQGSYVARIGGDGGGGSSAARYRFVNNTFVLQPSTPAVVQVFERVQSVEFHNNVFYRQGGGAVPVLNTSSAQWTEGAIVASGTNNWAPPGSTLPSQVTGTRSGGSPGFVDLATDDLRLAAGSTLVDAGSSATPSPSGFAFPSPLVAPAYQPPLHAIAAPVPRPPSGTIDIGAYEYGSGATPTPTPTPTTTSTVPQLPPPPPPPTTTCITSSSTWQRQAFGAKTGSFTVEADVTPSTGAVDAAIGLASGPVSTWSSLASIVLFSPTGRILARNGASYTSSSSVTYVANGAYHLRMTVDLPSHTYSVFVTSAGAAEVQIADRYAFRTEQAAVTSLDGWALGSDVGSIIACNPAMR